MEALTVLKNSLDDDGLIIFYQTNRRSKGKILDKKYIISQVFRADGFNLVYDKIVLKDDPGKVHFFRPNFSHLFGFSKTVKSSKATPDVFPAGEMVYPNAIGHNAAESIFKFISMKKLKPKYILDPFCGRGTVLKFANENGFNAIGIDNDPEQIDYAKTI